MTTRIEDESCRRVGLSISGGGAEYPIWVLLGAPRADLEIEWLVSGTPSAAFSVETFEPCAVICEGCAADEFAGLPLDLEGYGYRLYLRSEEGG